MSALVDWCGSLLCRAQMHAWAPLRGSRVTRDYGITVYECRRCGVRGWHERRKHIKRAMR